MTRESEQEKERYHEPDAGVVQNQNCVSEVQKSKYAFEKSHGWRNGLLPSVNNCSKSGTEVKETKGKSYLTGKWTV